MALKTKVLWIVNMNTATVQTQFSKHALAIGATAVCIRTSSKLLADAIKTFHDLNMKVYGWRWPPASKAGAMKEANNVAENLIPKGLDGYVVDPESDKAGAPNDWNRSKNGNDVLADVAASFCKTIKDAAAVEGNPFVFGTTSGCAYPANNGKPKIPWTQFFSASDVLLPQTYWRWTNPKTGQRGQKINGGTPVNAIAKGLGAWQPKAGDKRVVPMAGEVDVVTADEIAAFGVELEKMNVTEGHFYTDNGLIPVPNLAAMKSL